MSIVPPAADEEAPPSRFDAVDLFAGPGGWDEGARTIGLTTVGLEWDHPACQTAVAAGHARIRCDVAAYPTAPFAGIPGLIASPPCQAWSMAGARKGELDRANCHKLADRMAKDDDSLDWTTWEDERSALVCQPVRWVRDLRPEWVALEEVPAVLGLWEHFARIFRGWGYSAWVGVLCAADFGVAQTRERCILMASRVAQVQPPIPSHSREGDEGDLFGTRRLRWIAMADALGWGFTDAPAATISGGGAATGGAEPFANAAYRRRLAEVVLQSRRDSPKWIAEHGERENRTIDQPAPTITGEAHRWSFVAAGVTGEGRPKDPELQPADTLTGKGTAYWTNGDGKRRLTVTEAGVLQSFPADYPWQGKAGKRYQQVGNAVPPRLAAHVLGGLTGRALEVAA